MVAENARSLDPLELADIIHDLGGMENFLNIVENLQKALLRIEELEEKVELYKSLNRAMKLTEGLSRL